MPSHLAKAAVVVVLCGCGDARNRGLDADAGQSADDAAPAPVDAAADAPACDDGSDNDGDELVDGWDPECTTWFDITEDRFTLGLVDECMQDTSDECRFDSNSGGGDDATCALRAIPGCDCWGCCTMCDGGSCTTALMDPCRAPLCRFDEFANADLCPACEPDPACGVPCGATSCVLCSGQQAEDLPAECEGQPVCQGDVPTCGTDRVCPANRWCSHGCCVAR